MRHGVAGLLAGLAALHSTVLIAKDGSSDLRLEVTRFAVEGENPLSKEETDRILAPFLGEHREIEGIEAAADALQEAVQAKGDPFFRVVVPPQKPTGGVVTLSVVRYALGSVAVTGNEHFSDANILASIPALRASESVDMRGVSRALAVANENPAKRTEVVLRDGETPNAIDAEVKVKDVAPQQVFLGLSNTGTEQTGEWRASLGYQNANVFNRDHVFTASFTTSPDEHIDDVQQYGLFYSMPLYTLGNSLSAYFVYSNVDQGTVADFFQVSGAGQFYGVRYTHLFDRRRDYRHRLVFGVDQQLFDNDVSFSGLPVGVDVGAVPVSLRYEGAWERPWGNAGFFVEGVHNIEVGSDNNDAAYEANRAGADPQWNLARFGAEARYRLPKDFSLRGVFVGQFAGEPLIPGEQFGMGGANSVRGFRERVVTGDDGYQVSAEFWSPPWLQKQLPGTLQVLGFLDAGYRHFHDPPPGQDSNATIASVGVGARWQWKRLNVAADVALVIDGCTTGCAEVDTAGYAEAGDVGGHLSVFLYF
jgi:hemolysin activation/secretion protein